MSTVNHRNVIRPFFSHKPFGARSRARKGWASAITQRVKGWGIVTMEKHRVSAIKGCDLVHFAPANADFENPSPLDEATKAAALSAAIAWCKSNSSIVSKETVLACIGDEIKKTVRAIRTIRKEVLNADTFPEKLLAHNRLKAEEGRLERRRLNIFRAEDAVEDAIKAGNMLPFIEMIGLFPDAGKILEQLVNSKGLQ